jgi:hypothetical protein
LSLRLTVKCKRKEGLVLVVVGFWARGKISMLQLRGCGVVWRNLLFGDGGELDLVVVENGLEMKVKVVHLVHFGADLSLRLVLVGIGLLECMGYRAVVCQKESMQLGFPEI